MTTCTNHIIVLAYSILHQGIFTCTSIHNFFHCLMFSYCTLFFYMHSGPCRFAIYYKIMLNGVLHAREDWLPINFLNFVSISYKCVSSHWAVVITLITCLCACLFCVVIIKLLCFWMTPQCTCKLMSDLHSKKLQYSSYDERGTCRSEWNHNTFQHSHVHTDLHWDRITYWSPV